MTDCSCELKTCKQTSLVLPFILSRLDFTNFVTSVTAVDGSCVDSFIVTSPTGLTNPTVCGTLTDQHSK